MIQTVLLRLDRATTVVDRVYMRIQEETWPKEEENKCVLVELHVYYCIM